MCLCVVVVAAATFVGWSSGSHWGNFSCVIQSANGQTNTEWNRSSVRHKCDVDADVCNTVMLFGAVPLLLLTMTNIFKTHCLVRIHTHMHTLATIVNVSLPQDCGQGVGKLYTLDALFIAFAYVTSAREWCFLFPSCVYMFSFSENSEFAKNSVNICKFIKFPKVSCFVFYFDAFQLVVIHVQPRNLIWLETSKITFVLLLLLLLLMVSLLFCSSHSLSKWQSIYANVRGKGAL